MINLMRFLFLLIAMTDVSHGQFTANGTTKAIDVIKSNTQSNISLEPVSKVEFSYFAGDKVLQTNASKEIEESSISNTELSYLLGVTSLIQTQINSKQNILPATANGDILYYNGTEYVVLPYVLDGKFLGSVGGFPSWVDQPVSTTLTIKGQIQGHDGTNNVAIPFCVNDQLLLYDDSENSGWKCSDLPSTSPTTTIGQLIVRGVIEDEVLDPSPTVGFLLTSNGTGVIPSYQAPPVSLPDQTGNAYKTLTTNGSVSNWAVAERLNDQIKDNLLENPSYERELPLGSLTFVGAVDISGVANRNDQKSIHNAREYVINGVGAPFSFEHVRASAEDFAGRQMVAYCEIKTARNDVYFQVYPDGTNLLTELKVSSDDTHRYYRVPFSGDLAPEYRVTSKGNVASGEVREDNCFLGVSDNETQEITGTLKQGYYLTQASNTLLNQSGEIEFNLATANIENTGDTLLVASDDAANTRTIFTSTKDGLVVNVSFYTFVDLANRTAQIYKNGVVYTEGTIGDASNANVEIAVATPITLNEGEYFSVATGNNVRNISAESILSITALYVSPTASTIVTQDTELTKKTTNTLVARSSSVDVISEENYDGWVTASTSGNSITYTYVGLDLQDPMSCSVAPESSANNQYSYDIQASSNTSITFACIINDVGNGCANSNKHLRCEKTLRDVNKSQKIFGSFEQIKSDDLVLVEASSNDGDAITVSTEDIPFKTAIRDVNNLWSNAGNTGSNTNDAFTVPKTADYDFDISTRATANIQRELYLVVNGVITHRKSSSASYIIQPYAFMGIALNEGDVVTFRTNNSMTLTVSPEWHYLRIIQRADTESIVANIMKGQGTKCQTKYLSANTSATGALADLTFNNLKLTKYYSFLGQHYSAATVVLRSQNNGVTLARAYSNSSDVMQAIPMAIFKPTTTTVSIEKVSAGLTRGDSTRERTWATLCELPETVIETTEFN